MRGRLSLIVHFSWLAIAAVAAYVVYSAPEEAAEPVETPILDIELSKINQITFSQDNKIVDIAPRPGGGLTVSVFKREAEVPDPEKWDEVDTETAAAADGGVPEALVDETERAVYRASRALEETLEKIFPLTAKRRLGVLAGDELGRFGFAGDGGRLSIEAKGQAAVFEVGSSSYGGTTTYLRETPEGAVFLISADVIRAVDLSSPRYMERKILDLKEDEVTAVTVQAEERKKKLVKAGRGKDATWAAEGEKDAPSEMMANWVGALFRMNVKEYLLETPELTPLATLDIEKAGSPFDSVSLAWAKGEDEKKAYYAKSGYTGVWVQLSRLSAESVASDLEAILQTEE